MSSLFSPDALSEQNELLTRYVNKTKTLHFVWNVVHLDTAYQDHHAGKCRKSRGAIPPAPYGRSRQQPLAAAHLYSPVSTLEMRRNESQCLDFGKLPPRAIGKPW